MMWRLFTLIGWMGVSLVMVCNENAAVCWTGVISLGVCILTARKWIENGDI